MKPEQKQEQAVTPQQEQSLDIGLGMMYRIFFFLLLSLFLLCDNAIMKITKATLIADPRVQRLLKNPNWKHAAEAAMDYIFNGTECQIASWRKSSTWAQVTMVWEELNKTR
jgi:hypothetical protein